MRHEVMVINLDRSPERLERVGMQLRRLQILFSRISGVDGSVLSPGHLASLFATCRYFRPLAKGEAGCYLSHRACWQRVLDQQLDWAIIVEDDVDLTPAFADVPAAVAAIRGRWDMIKLSNGWRPRRMWPLATVGGFQVMAYYKIPAGTQSYVVSRRGAERLLQQTDEVRRPVDVDLQCWWEHGLEIVGLAPFTVSSPKHGESEIWRWSPETRAPVRRMWFALWFWAMNSRSWLRVRRQRREWAAVSGATTS